MRQLKVNTNQLKQLIADTVESLTTSSKSVTISLKDLLQLPQPELKDRPIISISEKAQGKMKALVQASSKEIAWHGLVTKLGDAHYRIDDIIVYPQEVTGTTVASDDDLYALWLDELDDDTFNSIRMQGHSHVNMTTSPSGTDIDYYDTLTKHINDYYIFIILNKSGSMWINLYDMINNVVYETKDLIIYMEGPKYNAWADEQIDEYIIEKSKVLNVGRQPLTAQDYLNYRKARGWY